MPPQDCTPATLDDFDGRKPDAVDVHVGSRVRYRRVAIGMSQGALGGKLKLTFQQIQKYESGKNRIGSSRLWRIAKALEVSPGYFFDGIDASAEMDGDAAELEMRL